MKLIDETDLNSLSNWAKFNMQTRGYRFKLYGKFLSKHKLFNIASLKFNLTNYDLKKDDGQILEYLSLKFEKCDAPGWVDGIIQQ